MNESIVYVMCRDTNKTQNEENKAQTNTKNTKHIKRQQMIANTLFTNSY